MSSWNQPSAAQRQHQQHQQQQHLLQQEQQQRNVQVAAPSGGWGQPSSALPSNPGSSGLLDFTHASAWATGNSAIGAIAGPAASALPTDNPRQSAGTYTSGSSNWGPAPAVQRVAASVTRGRATSDLPKPSWDSVPGWSTTPTTTETSAASTLTAASGWGVQTNNSGATSWTRQEPAEGWSSRPMAATSEGPSNWNRPVAAAQTPQQNYVSDGWVPVTPNPVNSVAAAHFSNLDTANWNRPAQSIEVSGWSPAASSTPASASGTQWASGAPMRNALQSQLAIAQQGAASGWGLAENTPVTEPNGWLAPRSSSDQNHLQQDVSRLHFASARLDDDTRRDLRKARSTAQLEGSSSPLARNVLTPQPSSLSSNFHTGDGSPSKDKDTASSTPSMRLFNRSFNEVNKSLGLGTTDDVQLRRSSNRSERRGGEELAKAIGIYIYGINKGVRVQDILAVFSKYGDISNVGIVTKENREGRIYAYVDYEEVGSAAKAIADVRGKPLFGIKEPLELRPHFDRKVAAEDPASPPPKKEKDAAPASGSQKKEVASKKSGITTNSKDSAGASGSATPAAEGSADISNKRTLHIANVPQHIEKSELEKLFRPFGEIRRIHIVQRPKEKRAFAFISFRTEELAAKALAAVKVGKHLGMSEPLKIEFSKADQHKDKEKEKDKAKDKEKDKEKEKEKDATKSEKSTASEPAGSGKAGSKQRPTDKPWKKGADLEKLLEKPSQASQTSKQTPTAPAATSRKASGGRTTIYIRDVPDGTNLDDLKAKFTAIGPLRSFFAVEKVGAGSTGKCAVVAFEKGADAAKAVKDRVDGVIFPRQRRLMIIGLPADFKLADLKSYLAEFGEIRRVDILKDETEGSEKSSSLTAEAEFARGDVAIVVFHKLLLSGYNGTAVRVGYSPSTGLTDAQGDVVPASAVEGGSNGRKDGNDTGDEADHEGERGGAGSRRSSQSSVAERGDISAQPLEPLATPVASSSGAHDYFASSSSEDETDIEVVEVSLVELDETSASVQSVDSVVSFDAPKPSSETPVPAAVLETSPPVAAVPKEE